jgi:sulfite exporter TauE/SafE
MLQVLVTSAVLMGLAGTPHCAAMCGAACRAAGGPRSGWFHAGRIASYAAAGAVAAASVGALAAAGSAAAVLRPLWTLLHVAALALGLWLLATGRQPAWMAQIGQRRRPAQAPAVAGAGGAVVRVPLSWGLIDGQALRGGGIGLGWALMPCGLLQSALLVAALANQPQGGALVMAGFAAASGLGLAAGPVVWQRLAGAGGPAAWASPALGARLAGAMLAGASGWALGHGLWLRVAAWCGVAA